MGKKDPRVDAYIEKSADFAKPILNHLREVVHQACPEVKETMKWNFPNFEYRGMLCNMAAFKQHCTFGFWLGSLVVGAETKGHGEAMGQMGRIRKVADLPSKKTLMAHIRKAMQLNEQGVKRPTRAGKGNPAEIEVPEILVAALKRNKAARATFEKLSPSHKKEYSEWITEAKREETRLKRLKTALEWMSEGKPRNWRYMGKC